MDIPRGAYKKLKAELEDRAVSIIAGARQVGKTFLLKKLMAAVTARGGSAAYYNLEMPADLRAFNGPDDEVLRKLLSSGKVVFIDEFHYIKNASRIFKMVYDSGARVKIYASGSSALEIHKHLKESLAGRRWLTRLMPLSYAEFCCKFGLPLPSSAFGEYCQYGGLPGLVKITSKERKIEYLNDILETYIQKDIKALLKEENIRAFNALLYLLAENQGSLISENGLSREVGLTAATINRYLSILDKTYVCYSVMSYAKKLGNELKKSKKVYFYDLGVRNAILRDFSSYKARQDKGAVSETFVLLQILSILKPNMEVRFWRNKQGDEIDFVVLKDRKPYLVEVKSSLSSAETPKAFSVFIKNYPETAGGMVVSSNLNAKGELLGKKVLFSTFEDFLPKLSSELEKI